MVELTFTVLTEQYDRLDGENAVSAGYLLESLRVIEKKKTDSEKGFLPEIKICDRKSVLNNADISSLLKPHRMQLLSIFASSVV